jgi:hypothetical protein
MQVNRFGMQLGVELGQNISGFQGYMYMSQQNCAGCHEGVKDPI